MHPERWAERARLGTIGEPSNAGVWFIERVVTPFVRLMFRPRLDGCEHVPKRGSFLLVANHSGMGQAEVLCFAACALKNFGRHRRITGMAHPFAFGVWPVSVFMRSVGAFPSTREHLQDALKNDLGVLVFPGGDHEALRPVWQARVVDFAGRKGFLKIARGAGVPIVPLGIRGSIYTAPVLWRSQRLLSWLLVTPRFLGTKRMSLTLLGLLGAVAIGVFAPAAVGWPLAVLLIWLWLAVPLSWMPWIPWTVRMTIGEPIAPDELFTDDDPDLDEAYRRVEGAVQELVAPPNT